MTCSGRSSRSRSGPTEKRASAVHFLEEKLAKRLWTAAELIQKWEELGGNRGTLLNARNTMQADGRLPVMALQGLQTWLRSQMEPPGTGSAAPDSEGGERGQEIPDAQNHNILDIPT